MPLGRIPVDDHVAPLDVTQAPQFSKKQTRSVVAAVLADQGGGNDRRDDGDPAAFCWLCAGGGRPRGSGTQQNHKSASLHAALVKREPRILTHWNSRNAMARSHECRAMTRPSWFSWQSGTAD